MKRLTPDFVLRTGEVQRHDALCIMLEGFGFKIRQSKGSHSIAFHTDKQCSDITCGLVHGTKNIIYQRIAAKACLEVEKRLVSTVINDAGCQSNNPDLPETDIEVRSIPDYLQVTRQTNQIIVRLREMPEIGLLYPLNEGDDLVEVTNMIGDILEEQKKSYLERLDALRIKHNVTMARESKTYRLMISSPLLWNGSYLLKPYSPALALTPLISIERVDEYLQTAQNLFTEMIAALRESKYIDDWVSETAEDGRTQKDSFKVYNNIRGAIGSTSFTYEANGSINSSVFVDLLDNLAAVLLPDDLDRFLGLKYGISVNPQRDGSVKLKQRFFGFEEDIPGSLKPIKLKQRYEQRIMSELGAGGTDFLKIYSDMLEDLQDVCEIYDAIEEMTEKVCSRIKNDQYEERFKTCFDALSNYGFVGYSDKATKFGYFTHIRFKHPEASISFMINPQYIKGPEGNNILLVSEQDFQKMHDAIEQAKLMQDKSPFGQAFKISSLKTRPLTGTTALLPQDPIRNAISNVARISRHPH